MKPDTSPLCFCEYINEDGNRSHLLALCCDCEELDDACERFVTCKEQPDDRVSSIYATLEDRLRIPAPGGAQKAIPLEVIIAAMIVPLNLWASQYACWALLISHAMWISFGLLFYKKVLKHRPRNKFFVTLSLSSTCYFFYVYQCHIVGIFSWDKTISPLENFWLVLSFFSALSAAFAARKRSRKSLTLLAFDGIKPEERYCRPCGGYVADKDHHCLWIDACISRSNLNLFTLFLLFMSLTLIQGALIFLTSACRDTELYFWGLVLIPVGCSNVNEKFSGSADLVWACGIQLVYLSILVTLMLVGMICKSYKKRRHSV